VTFHKMLTTKVIVNFFLFLLPQIGRLSNFCSKSNHWLVTTLWVDLNLELRSM
jgi:hypothetical protein